MMGDYNLNKKHYHKILYEVNQNYLFENHFLISEKKQNTFIIIQNWVYKKNAWIRSINYNNNSIISLNWKTSGAWAITLYMLFYYINLIEEINFVKNN